MHKYPIQKELLTTSRRSAQVNAVRRKATNRYQTPSGSGARCPKGNGYKQYQPEDITAALYLVATSQASIIQAAKQFNIPTRTLYQRIYNIKKLYATPSSRLSLSKGERAMSVLVPNEPENDCCVKIETDERDVDHGGETASQGPEHIVIKLEPHLLSEVLDPPELILQTTSQELCDSEGLKNLMLTSLHTSTRCPSGNGRQIPKGSGSLRVPSTFMSQ